ncbi:MAG: hypothetical protein ACRD9R_14515 [Pyrinomonadaceae bacterium]
MTRLTIRFAVALLTFSFGLAAATTWLLLRPAPAQRSSVAFNPPVSITTETRSAPEPAHPCLWQRQIEQVLPQLLSEFALIEKKPTIKRLVELDGKLRSFFDDRPEYYPCGDDAQLLDEKYAKMGVSLDYWSLLTYNGDLLLRAHRMNPSSKYRGFTLYSTVEPAHGLGVMPNIKAAYRYEQEFPTGPFIKETLSVIADFNKDLYMVLRDDPRDYKYDCFKPYIGKSPRILQRNRALIEAFVYYQKVLAMNPNDTSAKMFLHELSDGTVKGWSFCAD